MLERWASAGEVEGSISPRWMSFEKYTIGHCKTTKPFGCDALDQLFQCFAVFAGESTIVDFPTDDDDLSILPFFIAKVQMCPRPTLFSRSLGSISVTSSIFSGALLSKHRQQAPLVRTMPPVRLCFGYSRMSDPRQAFPTPEQHCPSPFSPCNVFLTFPSKGDGEASIVPPHRNMAGPSAFLRIPGWESEPRDLPETETAISMRGLKSLSDGLKRGGRTEALRRRRRLTEEGRCENAWRESEEVETETAVDGIRWRVWMMRGREFGLSLEG
ncbi:hypothetical protein BT69DRAFT_1278699, partial [Atractiella rhizophila]